jgi:hypothetical protein
MPTFYPIPAAPDPVSVTMPAWMQQREALLVAASEPSLTTKTITSLARATADQKGTRSKDLASAPAQLQASIDSDVR